MTTALAIQNSNTAIVQWGMTRDQLDLIKRTFADGTTDDEFALFMTTAHRLGLDVFAKQIYAVKRPTWDPKLQRKVDKLSIQVGIDGFRKTADDTGENDGQDGPFWAGDDGVWKDVWLADEAPAAAMVRVYRKGRSHPFTGVATYRSYVQTKADGKPVNNWNQMPDVMLAKCAEALALRKAFPAKLSGVYAPEEMGQADNGRDIKPANVQDAEVVGDSAISERARDMLAQHGADLISKLREVKTPSDLRAFIPQLNALPKGTTERAQAMEVFKEMDSIFKQEAARADS